MDRKYDIMTFISKYLYFKKVDFADIIRIVTIFIKTQKKFKEFEIMHQNLIYTGISWYSRICWFSVKKH